MMERIAASNLSVSKAALSLACLDLSTSILPDDRPDGSVHPEWMAYIAPSDAPK